MKLTMNIIKELILEQMNAPQKIYSMEECSLYVVNEGETSYLLIVAPDGFDVGLVAAKKPAKDCNFSVQVKNVATAQEYRGKGFGKFLYYAAEILGKEYQGTIGGITSDHEESSSQDAKNAWNRMSSKKEIEPVVPSIGRAKFDYTGEETPTVQTDDCDIPSSGEPAVDYAFKFSRELKSRYSKIFRTMVKNSKTNPMSEEEIGNRLMALWEKVY